MTDPNKVQQPTQSGRLFGIDIPIDRQSAAFDELQRKLDEITAAERSALEDITRDPRIIGTIAINDDNTRGEN